MARISMGVRELFDLAKPGGFDLPAELVTTYEACLAIQRLDIGALDVFDVGRAAEEIIAIARRGEPLDLFAVGRDIESGTRDRAAAKSGQDAQRIALERASEELTVLAGDLTETIITDCLRPVFETVLEEAKEPAQMLRDHPVTTQDLALKDTNEVRKVRAARRQLEPLAQQRTAIMRARGRANAIGNRKPQNDFSNMFSVLRRPQVFDPGWVAGGTVKLAYPQIPETALEALAWYATDGVPAEPWLPTVALARSNLEPRCMANTWHDKRPPIRLAADFRQRLNHDLGVNVTSRESVGPARMKYIRNEAGERILSLLSRAETRLRPTPRGRY